MAHVLESRQRRTEYWSPQNRQAVWVAMTGTCLLMAFHEREFVLDRSMAHVRDIDDDAVLDHPHEVCLTQSA